MLGIPSSEAHPEVFAGLFRASLSMGDVAGMFPYFVKAIEASGETYGPMVDGIVLNYTDLLSDGTMFLLAEGMLKACEAAAAMTSPRHPDRGPARVLPTRTSARTTLLELAP